VTGSVKIIPPAKDSVCCGWKGGALFRPKVQHLGLLSGENRQELAHEMKVRLSRFVAGDPIFKGVRPSIKLNDGSCARLMVRKLQIYRERYGFPDVESLRVSIEHCVPTTVETLDVSDEVIEQVEKQMKEWQTVIPRSKEISAIWAKVCKVPRPLPPRQRVGRFWMYDVVRQMPVYARVLGPAKTASPNPQLLVEQTCMDTGAVLKVPVDEEDVDSYISNGFSKEAAKLATNCLLCEVCLVSCHFPVDLSDMPLAQSELIVPPSESDLREIKAHRPSLMCSGCNVVVHVDCLSCKDDFMASAVAHNLVRTNRDWFCEHCIQEPDSWLHGILKYGYQAGPDISRKPFEKLGQAFKDMHGISSCKDETVIEKQFWSLINSPGSENITMMYGSDLDSRQVVGSEVSSSKQASWSLRELAKNSESVLRHLPGAEKIEGVSRPWMYLGNPLSTFCWHTEDQFLCSINFLHEGASKIWYTVPGSEREKLEQAMRVLLPDLVERNRDLHHQLVTLIDPITLCSPPFLIRIGRVVQRQGEFVLTFPGAYHAGFNTGTNLAEAVNVAVPDWLPHAKEAVKAYALSKRQSVFCVEELAWKTAEAVLKGDETRKAVAAFSVEMLTDVVEQMDSLSAKLKRSGTAVARKFMEIQDKPVCCECNQFCFFYVAVFSHGNVCGTCTSGRVQEPQAFLVKWTKEDIAAIVEKLENRLDNCSEPRRSLRACKRLKHI
jgi:hypothetical protein